MKNSDRKLSTRLQSGQAMVEYVVLLTCFAMGALFIFRALPQALAAYTHGFYYVWSKPIL